MITVTEGDICNINEESTIICQQCNCTTNRAFGLSSAINKKYPYANIYSGKTKVDSTDRKPGKVIIRQSILPKSPIFINMLAQVYPSKASNDLNSNDTIQHRHQYFKDCLNEIKDYINKNNKNKIIYMPFGIGCGLAGGNWNDYYKMIETFSNDNYINVVLVKLKQ